MKKSFLYLFTVLCTLSFFTACSDDDDPKDPNVLDVNASYSGDKLDLKYGNSALLGKDISFETKDGKTATITMKGTFDMSIIGDLLRTKSTETISLAPGVIPGEITTTLSNVALTLSGEKYTFEGTDTNNGRELKYSGEVQKDKLTMAVNVTMPSNDLVGTWGLAPLAPANQSMPLVIGWKSETLINVDGALLGQAPGTVIPTPVDLFFAGVNMKEISPKLLGTLESITYQADGNIVASYKKAGASSWAESPINLAQYYIKDKKVYVQLNIDNIIALVQANKSKADATAGLTDILTFVAPLLSQGVPLNYSVNNGVAQITAGSDLLLPLLKMATSETLYPLIQKMIPDKTPEMYMDIIAQIPGIVATTSEASVTLNLIKK